jgi:NAD(P)H-dependent FMN reductase
MSRKIIAFGASNSKNSINKKLATYAAQQMANAEITILDLNDFEMPIYSIDRENESGIPALASSLKQLIKEADGLIISFAEHNSAYTVAFKNVMDWMSRLEGTVWENKPMFLLATSPGGRGGSSVLALASNSFKYMNDNSLAFFSLPAFHINFSTEECIVDASLSNQFNEQLKAFSTACTGDE